MWYMCTCNLRSAWSIIACVCVLCVSICALYNTHTPAYSYISFPRLSLVPWEWPKVFQNTKCTWVFHRYAVPKSVQSMNQLQLFWKSLSPDFSPEALGTACFHSPSCSWSRYVRVSAGLTPQMLAGCEKGGLSACRDFTETLSRSRRQFAFIVSVSASVPLLRLPLYCFLFSRPLLPSRLMWLDGT